MIPKEDVARMIGEGLFPNELISAKRLHSVETRLEVIERQLGLLQTHFGFGKLITIKVEQVVAAYYRIMDLMALEEALPLPVVEEYADGVFPYLDVDCLEGLNKVLEAKNAWLLLYEFCERGLKQVSSRPGFEEDVHLIVLANKLKRGIDQVRGSALILLEREQSPEAVAALRRRRLFIGAEDPIGDAEHFILGSLGCL